MDNTPNAQKSPKSRKKRRWLIVLAVFIVVLIVARLIMPYVVLKYVNKTLSGLKEYHGHVEDIDIALIRGAYQINDIRIEKKDTLTQKVDTVPFFESPQIDLSVEWRALFKGRVVGEIVVDRPIVNFVQGKHKNEDVKADTTDFKDVLDKLMPLTINHFDIHNGTLRYVDKNSSPHVDLSIKHLQVQADNLSNVNDSNKVLPAGMTASGDAYGGHLDLKVKFNALEKKPTFDMNTTINGVKMVELNDFFKAYGKFEVKKGIFGLYTEFAAKEGAFTGYVKPLLKDVEIDKEKGNFAQQMWSYVVAGAAEILKNHKADQVATKIPIKGRFDDPKASLWTAISYVLRNAFVFALKPAVDNTIDIGKVENMPEEKKTFLQKVFGKKDKDKEGDKKDKSDKKDRNKKK